MTNLTANKTKQFLTATFLTAICFSASAQTSDSENAIEGQTESTFQSSLQNEAEQQVISIGKQKNKANKAIASDNATNLAVQGTAKSPYLVNLASQLRLSAEDKKGKTREQIIELKKQAAQKFSEENNSLAAQLLDNDKVLALSQQQNAKQARYYYSFNIYDAISELIYDIDGDGYFREFSVIFDADVITSDGSSGYAEVYAELYLSYQGGPWKHYFSTDDFSVYGENSDDEYEVTSTLHQGYVSGDYDILIDLYEVGYSDIVATISADDINSLYALPLESSEYDQSHHVQIIESSGSGGSLGGYSLLMLLTSFMLRLKKGK